MLRQEERRHTREKFKTPIPDINGQIWAVSTAFLIAVKVPFDFFFLFSLFSLFLSKLATRGQTGCGHPIDVDHFFSAAEFEPIFYTT